MMKDHQAVPWGKAVSRRPVFDPRSVHVRFVENKEETERVLLHKIRFFHENINQPLFRTHLDLAYISLQSHAARHSVHTSQPETHVATTLQNL
jgi:hypothetical protein